MQTCPASMPYDNQRIRDVVDDAVELDVATKMVRVRVRVRVKVRVRFSS